MLHGLNIKLLNYSLEALLYLTLETEIIFVHHNSF
jgi:hypothetical protein